MMKEYREQAHCWIWASNIIFLPKKGAWISFEGNLVGQGREAAKQALAEDTALMETITKAIMEKVQVTVGAVLAQGTEQDS